MDCLFEIIVPLLGELLIGGGIELIAEGIGRLVGWLFSPISEPPGAHDRVDVGRGVLWVIMGVAAGFLSLLIVPRHIVHVTALQVLNLAVTPLLMAAVTVKWGEFLSRRTGRPTPRNHFVCAYGFALCYLLVRFSFAK